MSARVEAAREAVADAMVEHGPDGHIDGYEEITAAALAAADAVMFSDEAVERAAETAFPIYWSTPVQDDISAEDISGWKEESRQKVRAVIAALKRDDA